MTLELTEELIRRGWEVDVYSNLFMPPMAEDFVSCMRSGQVRVAHDPYESFGADYDLIWIQHGMLPPSTIRRIHEVGTDALVVWHHMSSQVELEFPILRAIEEDFADVKSFNALETWTALREFGLGASNVRIFPNPAPHSFSLVVPADRDALERVLFVSNHPPQELMNAAQMLSDRGIEVAIRGEMAESSRITPEIIADFDAIVTIGKTVQYALTAGLPVYEYDHFGGVGWLTASNLDYEADFNFSGRPSRRLIGAAEIVDELISGYGSAHSFARDARADNIQRFGIDSVLDHVLEEAPDRRFRRISKADQLQWLAFSELIRGMYRTTEFFRDEASRLARENDLRESGRVTGPDSADSSFDADQASVGLTLIVILVGDSRASERAAASAIQQTALPNSVVVVANSANLDRATTLCQYYVALGVTARIESVAGPDEVDLWELLFTEGTRFVAIQDGTATWHPRFLSESLVLLEDEAIAAVVCEHGTSYDRLVNGVIVPFEHDPAVSRASPAVVGLQDQLGRNNTRRGLMVFRREAALAGGAFSGDSVEAQDWIMGLRLLRFGPILITPSLPSLELATWHVLVSDEVPIYGRPAPQQPSPGDLDVVVRSLAASGLGDLVTAFLAVQSGRHLGAQLESTRAELGNVFGLVLGRTSPDGALGLEQRVVRFVRSLPRRVASKLTARLST